MKRKCYLVREEHTPEKARFPAIDAHNHLWGDWSCMEPTARVMDECGVAAYCDLTANIGIDMVPGGYVLKPGDITEFFRRSKEFGKKFYCFTTATFARDISKPLYTDKGAFVEETIEVLRRDAAAGARGLKILKELGLHYRDGDGELVRLDDEAFSPVWREAARLGVPVLMHQTDPYGFFEPVTEDNEHYESLKKFSSWSFADPKFPRKEELLARRDRMIAANPETTFILPHVANFPENMKYVSRLLDDNPNVFVDFSARMDELGRQPYTSREFFIAHQDRILFGTDMPATPEMYRSYFRFLETFDEWFQAPDYDGTFDRSRWNICGIGLPDGVLKKIYHGNAMRIIPGLTEIFK